LRHPPDLNFPLIYAIITPVIDNNAERNKTIIKKIINPISGSTLFLKKFKDSPLSQVSSTKSFDIPTLDTLLDQETTPKEAEKNQQKELDTIKKDIHDILKHTTKTNKASSIVIQKLKTQNKHLSVLCYTTLALLALSIFF
jgi:hypothetical protein